MTAKKPWHKARYPRAKSILIALDALQRTTPTDAGMTFGWRTSEAGTPNLRVEGATGELHWRVDLYGGHFYRAAVGQESKVWRSIPALVSYLRQRLGLGPIPDPHDQPQY